MNFLKEFKHLWLGIAVIFILIAGRMYHTHTFRMAFLFWNFFLALLPLYFSYKVKHATTLARATIFTALWLLFFPNAAYLFTDIVHLKPGSSFRYWVNLIILFLSEIYGIFITVYSLHMVEGWYALFVSKGVKLCITACLFLLCGYRIYLGRVERWNSWDVATQPQDLLHAILHHLRHPFQNRMVWYMTLLFATGLQLIYRLFDKRVYHFG